MDSSERHNSVSKKPFPRSALLMLGCLLVAVAAGLYVYLRSRSDRGSGSGSDSAEIVRHLRERREARLQASAGLGNTSCAVSGRVTRADGEKIAGAVVTLITLESPDSSQEPFSEWTTPRTAVADAAGHWSMPKLPRATYAMTVTALGFAPKRFGATELCTQGIDALIDAVLEPGGVLLTGTITDTGGGPVAGAVISAMNRVSLGIQDEAGAYSTVSDDQGKYRLPLTAGAYFVLVSHPEYARATDAIDLGDSDRRLDFALVPGATVQGTVRDADTGKAVPEMRVQVRGELGASPWSMRWVKCDTEGHFEITNLHSGTLELTATGRGYGSAHPTSVEVGVAEKVPNVDVWVTRGLSVSGFVVMGDDKTKGVQGVTVGVHLAGTSDQSFTVSERTDQDGFFEIAGLKPGNYEAVLASEPFAKRFYLPETRFELRDRSVDGLLLVVHGGVSVSGHVEPPMAGVVIRIESREEKSDDYLRALYGAARTKQDGQFTITDVEGGTHAVTAEAPDGRRGRADIQVAKTDVTGVVLQLESKGSVAGRVVDTGREGVAGVTVLLRPSGFMQSADAAKKQLQSEAMGFTTTTETDGAFKVDGLAPGNYEVGVYESSELYGSPLAWTGESDARVPLLVRLNPKEHKDGLILQIQGRDGKITGKVIDSDAPVPDVWITATLQGDYVPGRPVLTDQDGRFVLEGLRQSGTYDLVAQSARGEAVARQKDVKVGADLTIKLESVATLSGIVRSGGAPVVVYRISASGPVQRAQHVWSADGRYSLDRLDPGKYEVAVSAEQGHVRTNVDIAAGTAQHLDLELVRWGSVRGTLVHVTDRKPVADVDVFMMPAGSPEASFASSLTDFSNRSDAQGNFLVSRAPTGTVSMSFRRNFSPYYTLPKPTAGPSTGPEFQKKLVLSPGQDLDLGTIELYTSDDLRDWWKKAEAGQQEGDASIASDCTGEGKLVDINPSVYSAIDSELPLITGGDFADSKGLKGYLYFIPAGTQWLSLLPSCTPQAVLFANKLDVTPRDFTSGFLGVSQRFEWFAIDFFGPFEVTEPGVYTFRLQSDDGSILWIDGQVVANNDGAHGAMNILGNAQLTRGVHAIRILYYQGLRTRIALQLFVTPPNRSEQLWTTKL